MPLEVNSSESGRFLVSRNETPEPGYSLSKKLRSTVDSDAIFGNSMSKVPLSLKPISLRAIRKRYIGEREKKLEIFLMDDEKMNASESLIEASKNLRRCQNCTLVAV